MSALSDGSPVAQHSSGIADEEEEHRQVFSFRQPVPIPSYLLALVVGELESRDISDRCRIWSEPSVVEAAAYDFSQTEVSGVRFSMLLFAAYSEQLRQDSSCCKRIADVCICNRNGERSCHS